MNMNDVEEVKNRLDIVEIIGGYIELKKAGSNYKGLSPFKSEKTPSFMVSAEKNIWHDFSSGKGGDVISFVMEVEGLNFPEALEMLAKRAGVELKPRTKEQTTNSSNKNRLYEANELAMKYFHVTLSKNQTAKDYFLKERAMKTDIIKQYRLGYAPDSWEGLSNFLQKKGFSPSEIIKAGLGAKSNRDQQSVYDIFRGRIMFPVFDMQNRTIGFSARILKADADTAKYINTPQTDIYNKSLAIYGLAQAKEAIRHKDRVVIVEGNMDVLALANAGFQNVVACSGTALTELQLKQLSRLTKNIYLSLDQDAAGIAAAQRAIEIALPLDIRLHVVSFDIKGAKDPDELLRKDEKLWQQVLDEAKYAPDYLLDYAKSKYNVRSAVGKKDFVSFLLPLLGVITDDVERQHYTKKIAQIVESDEQSIQKMLKPASKTSRETADYSTPAQTGDTKKRRLNRLEKLEQELLELVLAYEPARDALEDIDPEQASELHRQEFVVLKEMPGATLAEITQGLPSHSDYVRILSLRGEQHYADVTAHDKRLEAFTQVQRINRLQKELNKRLLARQVAEAEAAGDAKQTKKLLQRYQELLNEE